MDGRNIAPADMLTKAVNIHSATIEVEELNAAEFEVWDTADRVRHRRQLMGCSGWCAPEMKVRLNSLAHLSDG